MGAKQTAARTLCLLASLSLLAGGCTTMRRLAPPGFVKYEDLAKGRPPNPDMVDRIKESQSKSATRFPSLSEQPATQPVPPSAADQAVLLASLKEAGGLLNDEIAADRAAAAAEKALGFAVGPDGAALDAAAVAAALATQIEADRAAAAADKAQD